MHNELSNDFGLLYTKLQTYEDLENIKTDRVNTVVFNLHQIKQSNFFWDTRYAYKALIVYLRSSFCITSEEALTVYLQKISLYTSDALTVDRRNSHCIPQKFSLKIIEAFIVYLESVMCILPKISLYTFEALIVYRRRFHFTSSKLSLYTSKDLILYLRRSQLLYTSKVLVLYLRSSHCIRPKF